MIIQYFESSHVPCNLGIPHGCRARSSLFDKDSLQKKTTEYPNIGQKKMNGASARMMLHFAVVLAARVATENPHSEIYRPAKKKGNNFNPSSKIPIFTISAKTICFVFFARWIADAFAGLTLMATIFAQNPRGPLPGNDLTTLEDSYMRYRRAYNSFLDF